MYGQTPLKILQMDIISFNLTTKLLYGDNYSHFTKNENKKQSQRDLSVMWKWRQLDIGRIWVFHLQYPWLLSAQTEAHTVCTVNAELVSLNSAWIRSKEHMCSALGSVLRWEYVQRLKAEPWGIWKVCDGKNGGRDSMSANFGKWR